MAIVGVYIDMEMENVEMLLKLADAFAEEDDALNPWTDPQEAALDLRRIAAEHQALKEEVERLREEPVVVARNLINDIQSARKENAALQSRVRTLKEACHGLMQVFADAHAHWDADRDSKVGKILIALSGKLPGYRADIDAFHEALNALAETEHEPIR